MLSALYLFLFLFLCFLLWTTRRSRVSRLADIPGPPSSSWIRGNLPELLHRHGWQFQDALDTKYGPIVRIKGLFGKSVLYVADPKALSHIVGKDQHIYERALPFVSFIRLLFGHGLLGTLGEHHHKQRKMLNPVFSSSQIRKVIPVLYEVAHRLKTGIFNDLGDRHCDEIDMLQWINRITLEFLGQGGFGYSFDSLSHLSQSTFGDTLKLLAPTVARCLTWRMLSPYVPNFGSPSMRRRVIDMIPDKDVQQLKAIVDIIYQRSRQILEDKTATLEDRADHAQLRIGEDKDIMSILLKANNSSSKEDRLSEEELVAQISTLVFAGTDTTSCALAHCLELLAKNADIQQKLRAEIMRAGKGQDIPYEQLVGLPYLDAVCKETLRLHPPASFVLRETRSDVVLPFSQPIHTADGSQLSEVVLPKDTMVVIGIRSCNRLNTIWGEDSTQWKPERWLSETCPAVNASSAKVPGVYANMMTFLGGSNSCIGLQYSLLEMKVTLSTLLTSFALFPGKEVVWNWASISYPTVGPISDTPRMPLRVQHLYDEMYPS